MATTFDVYVDWDAASDFSHAAANITDYVEECTIRLGFADAMRHIANVGTCVLVLDNTSRLFSPAYAGGALYGNLVPGRTVRVRGTDGGTTWTLFLGTLVSLYADPGDRTRRQVVIECEDRMGTLARATFGLALQENRNMTQMLSLICSNVWSGTRATGTVTFSGTGSAGGTITVGSKTYTLRSGSVSAANDVLIGASGGETAIHLAAAINGDVTESGAGYHANTRRNADVSASVDGPVVTVTALEAGTVYNSVALADTDAAVAVSDATLTGGADAPAGAISFETGTQTFSTAADRWQDDYTTAMSASEQVMDSEFGYLWVARDGTITAKDANWELKQVTTAAALTLEGQGVALDNTVSLDDMANHVLLEFQPRTTESEGVIAKANSIITVPGMAGISDGVAYERWNKSSGYPGGGTTPVDAKVVRLSFTDQTAGQVIGAKDIITPIASTDYTVNDREDGTGFDYTNTGRIKVSAAITGGGVELTFSNDATGPLYISGLQVRGTAIVGYDAQQIIREDEASVTAYRKRTLSHGLSLPSNELFAESVANYLLGRYKNPAFMVKGATVHDTDLIGAAHPLSVEIGDTIAITDNQLSITAQKYLVRGFECVITSGGLAYDVTWPLKRLDDVTYWILDDATYSVLDSTTRLAL